MILSININRLNIALQGVSAQMIEEATQGLDNELRRRLGSKNIGQGLLTNTAMVDLGELHLGQIHSASTLNAAGLREIIAQQLVHAVEMQTDALAEENR